MGDGFAAGEAADWGYHACGVGGLVGYRKGTRWVGCEWVKRRIDLEYEGVMLVSSGCALMFFDCGKMDKGLEHGIVFIEMMRFTRSCARPLHGPNAVVCTHIRSAIPYAASR